MEEQKTDVSEYTNEVLIADLLIRLAAMESILVSKGVCTAEELQQITRLFSDNVIKSVLSKTNVSSNLKEFISSLQGNKN